MPTVLKSVITTDTFFFTENRDLKVVITAYRLVFETAIPRVEIKITAKIENFSIRVFVEHHKPGDHKMSRDTILRLHLQFMFEWQEGLPAISDLRQGKK